MGYSISNADLTFAAFRPPMNGFEAFDRGLPFGSDSELDRPQTSTRLRS